MAVTVWKTKDGRAIPVKELEDSHLKNVISHLRKMALRKLEVLEYQLLAYAENAPDGAAMAAENEAGQIAEMDADEWLEENCKPWKALKREAERRGILSGENDG